jgi:hypothetical protein
MDDEGVASCASRDPNSHDGIRTPRLPRIVDLVLVTKVRVSGR